MWEWLKKQTTRDKAPGVQTMADLFSRDVLPKKMADYFEPTPEVRTRDFFRELPGAVGNVAKEIAQGTARSFDWAGRKVAPYLLPNYEDKRKDGDWTSVEQFLFGDTGKAMSESEGTIRDVAETEWGLNRESMFAPLVGGITVGLDLLPFGKGYRSSFKAMAESTDKKQILGILKLLRPDVDEKALKNVADVLVDTKTGKEVKDIMDTLVPGTKDIPLSKPRDNKATKGEDGKFTGSEAGKGVTKQENVAPPRGAEELITAPKTMDEYNYKVEQKPKIEEVVQPKEKAIATEAKKHKSAEEFVNSMTDSSLEGKGQMYIGVPKIIRSIDEFNLGKQEIGKVNSTQRQTSPEVVESWKKRIESGDRPPIVTRNGTSETQEWIMDGHNRLKAYQELGFTEVPTVTKSQLIDIWNKANPTPAFDGLKGLTLKTLEKLKGRTQVSSDFIQNLLRSQDVTKQERDAITEVLLTKGHKVNVKELAEEVQAQLLPLKPRDVGDRHSTVILPREKQPNIVDYRETVYESPVETSAGDIHYPGVGIKRYFAHTRHEDLADEPTRRVLEVQSDAIQKRGLEREADRLNKTDFTYADEENALEEFAQFVAKKTGDDIEVVNNKLTSGEIGMDHETSLGKAFLESTRKEGEERIKPLTPYAQTWWKRIVREEVQKAVDDGKEILQFPTGKTAMEIEGLGRFDRGWWNIIEPTENTNFSWQSIGEVEMGAGNLKPGMLVNNRGDERNAWVVLKVFDDGRFESAPLEDFADLAQSAIKNKRYRKMSVEDLANDSEFVNDYREVSGMHETFDVSGNIDTSNPIFRFYESDIGKYLGSRYNAYRHVDSKGVEWMQIDLAGMPKGAPVEAFAVAPIAGLETDEEGNITGFDPVKAGLGFAVAGGIKKASGSNAYKQSIESGKNTLKLSTRRSNTIERYGLNEDSVTNILDAQRRQTIPHPKLVEMAGDIPVNFKKLLSMQPGAIAKGEQVEAYKQAVAGYKSYTRKLRENHLAKPQDILLKKQYDDAMAVLTRSYANLEALYSEAGRVVESAKIFPHSRTPIINTNIQKVRSQLPPEAQVKFDMDLENLDLDNPSDVMRFLTDAQDATWMQKIVEYYRSSLLSAVTTNVINATGNLLSTIADIPVRAIAGGISKGRTALTGKPRDVYIGEAWKLLSVGVRSTNEATIHAMRALIDEHYALQYNRSLIESGSQIPAIKGKKGEIIRLPYRLLSAMDMFFRTIKTNSEKEALLYRLARQEGHEGQALMVRMEELRRTPPAEVTEMATTRAERALYLEETEGVLKSMEQLKNKHPWMQMLVPFYRTLINLMREAHRMTPVRFASRDKWIKGADTKTEEVARATLGTAVGLYLMNTIMDGRLEVTGAAPVDKKQRDTFYGTGKIPYAIRVGDSWVPYQRLQPFSTILFSSGKLADLWNFHKETGDMSPDDVADAANVLTSEITQFFVQQAPMQGIATFLEFLEGGKYNQGTLPAAGDFFAQMLGGFVPNIIYSGVRAYDPTIYTTQGVVENVQKRIPGLQNDLVPRRNAFGETVERPGTAMGRFLNPFNPSEIQSDPIYAELERLETGVGFPTKKAFQQDLTVKEYDVLLRDAGPRTREQIWKLMQSPTYQRAPDDRKVEMIDDVVIKTRRESVASLFPHRREQLTTMEQLLRAGATPREAYEISQEAVGITDDEAGTIADILLQKRKEEGKTPPTLGELLRQ